MNERRTMMVRTDSDIIVARSRVRDLARAIGLGTVDQARISLATSLLAYALELGGEHQGQIVIDRLREGERTGVRVVCKALNGTNGTLTSEAFSDARRMADELTVEKLPSSDVQVILVKWAMQGGNHG